MEIRTRGRLNKLCRYENTSESRSNQRDHSFDSYNQSNILANKKQAHIKREASDIIKRKVVTLNRRTTDLNNKKDIIITSQSPNYTYNKIDKCNQLKNDSLYKREKESQKGNYKHILTRYSNSPIRDHSKSNSNNNSNKNQSSNDKQERRGTNYNSNLIHYEIPNTQQVTNTSQSKSNKSHKTSYTKYGTALRYSHNSCWTNTSSNNPNQYNNQFGNLQLFSNKYSNDSNNKLSHQKIHPACKITRIKTNFYDYQMGNNHEANNKTSNQNKPRNNSNPFQMKNDYLYCNNSSSLSTSNQIHEAKCNITYQRIPICSKLLRQDSSSIKSKGSSSHSPSLSKTQLFTASALRTNSTGIGTFEDSHLSYDVRKKSKIETIEELHFAFVNVIQNANQLMRGLEGNKNQENPLGAVTDIEERDFYH